MEKGNYPNNDIVDLNESNICDKIESKKSKRKALSSNVFLRNISKGIGIKIAEISFCVLLLIGGWYFIRKNPFDWNFTFWNTELKIDNTANVVEKIKKIAEFSTICYYEETVIKNEKKDYDSNAITDYFNISLDSIHEEIVIISKGKVRAGFDLTKVDIDDIRVSSDTISIELPYPEVLDVIANPSDYEIFVENGDWSHEEIVALQVKHRDQLLNSAVKAGILEKAIEDKEKISELLKTLGFKSVTVKIKNVQKQ